MALPTLCRYPSNLLPIAIVLIVLPCLTYAFGAGNIGSVSAIEGQNWRHGDIEDTLLNILMARAAGGKKFTKLDVKRVYFGNWLRDYSQAVDVGTVKAVSAEAIRILLWILGFLSFGYGTKEFEVTTERLGCYRPEEHIDNPKDYADNVDARQYDRRLRGPVDERRELAIDPRTALKMYIASEDAGITTSAGLVRNLFGRSIALGRRFARSKNNDDLYEALRLLGTGCHCLEDFSAHSNYVELCLRTMGETQVFPHVGMKAAVRVQGMNHPLFPIVTGTFGGVDFFHSVMGEFDDKVTQSEIQELEGTVSNTENKENVSFLKELLSSIPSGILGGKDQAGKADQLQAQAAAQKLQNTHITPRKPEVWTQYLNEATNEIRPILEFHDDLVKSITETMEKIPVLPEMIEKLQDQINVFVFSLLAPYVLPIIKQVKAELTTGSEEIIQSSREKQLIVFRDDHCSDPTHSMLSKDHFSNILNEPAGKVASQVLQWVVPQLMECWDNDNIDVDRTLTRIVTGVFHHPQLRDSGNDGAKDGRHLMFQVVEKWWHGKSESEKRVLRNQLSRDGVEKGLNHREGVHDQGHGCGKPLGMPNIGTAQSSGAIGGGSAAAMFGGLTSSHAGPGRHGSSEHSLSSAAASAVGGGVMGSIVGGLVGEAEGNSGGGGGGGRGGRGGRRASGGRGAGRGETPAFDSRQTQSYQQAPPSQSAYPAQSYQKQDKHHKSDSEDSESKEDKKARKRAEKEQAKEYEKAKKKSKEQDKKHQKHSDDDSDDSDDSGRGRASPRRGGGSPGRHGGGSPGRHGGGSPGRRGEYESYRYENQYQHDSFYPQPADRPQGAPMGAAEGAEGVVGVTAVGAGGIIEDRFSRRREGYGRRNDYDEGLAYGDTPAARRDDYDEGLAYGDSGYASGQVRYRYDASNYTQPDQYQRPNDYGQTQYVQPPYVEQRNEYRQRQEYGQAQGYQGEYGGFQSSYGGPPGGFQQEQYSQSYDRQEYQEAYDGRGDGGYGPGEDQRYGSYASYPAQQDQNNYYGSGENAYNNDSYGDEGYGRRN